MSDINQALITILVVISVIAGTYYSMTFSQTLRKVEKSTERGEGAKNLKFLSRNRKNLFFVDPRPSAQKNPGLRIGRECILI